jgi:stage V sporulation protein R
MAHVFGHADFFKHNFWFSKTDRKMMDRMANHATRVRRHIERHGQEAVERFIDACLTLEHMIDPHSLFVQREESRTAIEARRSARRDDEEEGRPTAGDFFEPEKLPAKDYMDPFINPQAEMDRQKKEFEDRKRLAKGRFPAEPARDVLLFLLRHAPLEPWQQDILAIIRDEAYYFAPQGMTKIMNEGWATYWHSKLMTQHFLEAREIVHYADQHSGVVHMPPGGFNPYKIGLELWKDIERRWDMGQHGPAWERLEGIGAREAHDDRSMKGREKLFEIRRIYNDVSFVDEFFTEEFVDRCKMYQTRKDPHTGESRIVSRDFERVKQTLLHHLTNRGQPFVYIVDANYLNRGELYLAHQWTGLEIEVAKALPVLQNLRLLWGRPVHLHARIGDEHWLFSCADHTKEPKKEKIGEDTPPPAHVL